MENYQINQSASTNETLDFSIMSGPPDICEICHLEIDVTHLCIPIDEFKKMGLWQEPEDQFVFFNEPAPELENDELVEYADEGEFENEPADLSIIDDLEESVGYQTQALETPPRRPAVRRSSTPDINRNRPITFGEFLENLINDDPVFPGLEDDQSDAEDESMEEFMEF